MEILKGLWILLIGFLMLILCGMGIYYSLELGYWIVMGIHTNDTNYEKCGIVSIKLVISLVTLKMLETTMIKHSKFYAKIK